MGVIHNIFREMKKNRVIENYEAKHRFIEPEVYKSLKSRKKCMRCKKKLSGRIPEIHHKIPISKGGTNERMNLMALCKKCHDVLDAEEGVGEKHR
jgi:5-methylcytosine-specific restriction endonuclease McrA